MHLALHKLKWKPSDWFNISQADRLFIIASFSVKSEDDEKQRKKQEQDTKKYRRR